MAFDLRDHLSLYRELLDLSEKEGRQLQQEQNPDLKAVHQTRENLLAKLDQSLEKLRQHRTDWQKLSPRQKSQYPEIQTLLRQSQDLIMKVLTLDRENEQNLLRRGLIPPSQLHHIRRPTPRQAPHLLYKT